MGAVGIFLDHCQEMLGLLLTAVHIFGGSPGRATELEVLLVKNKVNRGVLVKRNLFYMAQYESLLILPSYNKHGVKRLPRFLGTSLATALVFYLGVLRPEIEILNYQIDTREADETVDDYFGSRCESNYIWIDVHGIQMKATDIISMFTKVFSDVYGFGISFSEYRQLNTTLCNIGMKLTSPFEFRDVILKLIAVPHLQRGHSLATMVR